MPSLVIAAFRRVTISASKKGRISERASTSVTLTPRAANMQAYSQPITPPPKIVSDVGKSLMVRISSLSWIHVVCKIDVRRAVRLRAGGDQDEIGAQTPFTGSANRRTPCVRPRAARAPARIARPCCAKFLRNERDSAAAIAFLRDISRGNVALRSSSNATPYSCTCVITRQVERRLAQGLAGQSAGVHRGATRFWLAFDDRDAFFEKGRLRGGFLARGTCANHDQVEMLEFRHAASLSGDDPGL